MEILKNYDFELNYHPGKANVITNVLSRKSLHMSVLTVREMDLIEQFRYLSLVCEIMLNNVMLGMLKLTRNVLYEIKEGQRLDLCLLDHLVLVNQWKGMNFKVDNNEIVEFHDKVVCQRYLNLKRGLEEGYWGGLNMKLGITKMYHDIEHILMAKYEEGCCKICVF